LSEAVKVCEHAKMCSKCGDEKPLFEFYKKGVRWEAMCRTCLKRVRAVNYRRRKNLPQVTRGKISEVVVKMVEPRDLAEFRREMTTIELILENLIYNVLSKKLKGE
jgi:hypothetical protein